MPFIVSAAWQLSLWSTWQWVQWLQVRQKFKKTKKEPKAAAWWGGGATWRCQNNNTNKDNTKFQLCFFKLWSLNIVLSALLSLINDVAIMVVLFFKSLTTTGTKSQVYWLTDSNIDKHHVYHKLRQMDALTQSLRYGLNSVGLKLPISIPCWQL